MLGMQHSPVLLSDISYLWLVFVVEDLAGIIFHENIAVDKLT